MATLTSRLVAVRPHGRVSGEKMLDSTGPQSEESDISKVREAKTEVTTNTPAFELQRSAELRVTLHNITGTVDTS